MLSITMNEQEANIKPKLGNLIAENQKMVMESSNFHTELKNLTEMLDFILTFNTFPVDSYCQQKRKSSHCLQCYRDSCMLNKLYIIYLSKKNFYACVFHALDDYTFCTRELNALQLRKECAQIQSNIKKNIIFLYFVCVFLWQEHLERKIKYFTYL